MLSFAKNDAAQALINFNREMIARLEKKIQAIPARVWCEDEPGQAEA